MLKYLINLILFQLFKRTADCVLLAVAAVFGFILCRSLPFITETVRTSHGSISSIISIFTSPQWHPNGEPPEFGMAGLFYGSFIVTALAVFIAAPIGILSAAVLSDFVSFRIRQFLKPVIELLAAVPSVVFGFFAVKTVAPFLQDTFGFASGTNVINAAVILAVMIIPTIISVSEDALSGIGRELREASYALGSTRAETLLSVVLPSVRSGITAAVILGTMRAAGETMVVWMAAGNAANMPSAWYRVDEVIAGFSGAVRTMTATIAGDIGETPADSLHRSALFTIGLLLLIFTFLMNWLTEWLTADKNFIKRNNSRTLKGAGRKLLPSFRIQRFSILPRKTFDKCFSISAYLSVSLLVAVLCIILIPIFQKGSEAVIFQETVEHRLFLLEQFNRGNRKEIEQEFKKCFAYRKDIYRQLEKLSYLESDSAHAAAFRQIKTLITGVDGTGSVIGPDCGLEKRAALSHMPPEVRYGPAHWSTALRFLQQLKSAEKWEPQYNKNGDITAMKKRIVPRTSLFADTAAEQEIQTLINNVEANLREMLNPRWTFYGNYFFDSSTAGHYLGGIGPEITGTIILSLFSMFLALPLAVITAAYLVEVAKDNTAAYILRLCISTLAGVPSIVFGLFGLTVFVEILLGKPCLLAGIFTLTLLILPVMVRTAEEAIRSVPSAYREAAIGLGAGNVRTFFTVTLPVALPGILTGMILGISRAAGETAPLMFTCAAASGGIILTGDVLMQSAPVLSYSAYDIAVGDRLANLVPYNQFGIVSALILFVLLLNLTAVIIRGYLAAKHKV